MSNTSQDQHPAEVTKEWRGFRPYNLFKLFTSEDPLNVHKLLGVFSLAHYVFRLVSLLVSGSMGFERDSQAKLIFIFFVHLLLSWSSFVFPLPQRRNETRPMIWPELRWHNVIFATRSILDALVHIVGLGQFFALRVGLAFAAMIAADVVSDHYRKLNLVHSTTMRGMPFPPHTSLHVIGMVNFYYALSQLVATAGVINLSSKWQSDVELAFTTLFAVQLSALLMTLVRKNILDPSMWHAVYAWSLGLSWVLAFYRYGVQSTFLIMSFKGALKVVLLAWLRFKMNVNKYWLWSVFVLFGQRSQETANAYVESYPY